MTLIVEFGAVLSLLLLFAMSLQFYRNWRLARSANAHTRAVGLWANVGLVFFVLCCFIENYVEFPQAIFLPALLYVAAWHSTTEMKDSVRSPAVADGVQSREAAMVRVLVVGQTPPPLTGRL